MISRGVETFSGVRVACWGGSSKGGWESGASGPFPSSEAESSPLSSFDPPAVSQSSSRSGASSCGLANAKLDRHR